MAATRCENCGERVYGGFCVNCHEEVFIERQYQELGEGVPETISNAAAEHRAAAREDPS